VFYAQVKFGKVFLSSHFKMAPVVKRIYGFWGEPTSTLDWCEENYVVTSLVAEFCKSWKQLFNPSKILFLILTLLLPLLAACT